MRCPFIQDNKLSIALLLLVEECSVALREASFNALRAHRYAQRTKLLTSLTQGPSIFFSKSRTELMVFRIERKSVVFCSEVRRLLSLFKTAPKRTIEFSNSKFVTFSVFSFFSNPGEEAFFGFLLPPPLPRRD